MQNLNLAFRFILEMVALVAMFLWGLSAVEDTLIGVVAGVVLAGSVMAVWGLFVAPKASYRLADPVRLVVELAIFFVGVLALGFTVSWILGILFGLAVLISVALMFYWGQRGK